MNVNEYAFFSNKEINNSFEILTENNYHNDTSIFSCYIMLGLIPPESPDHNKIWGILEKLKEIDRKNYTQGFLRFDDLENRNKLDKQLERIYNKYEDEQTRKILNDLKNKAV